MKFIIGKKENMTQVFDDEGNVSPVTVIKVAPVAVTALRTKEKNGYSAVQVGLEGKNKKTLKEFRVDENALNVGDAIDASIFAVGDKVVVSAISKGKGFQGVVKRHGFAGGPRSHGQKHSERAPGSIGTAGFQRVFKNMRMAGRMGSDRITVKNLKVVKVENNEIFIKGAVPGRKGTLVEIKG